MGDVQHNFRSAYVVRLYGGVTLCGWFMCASVQSHPHMEGLFYFAHVGPGSQNGRFQYDTIPECPCPSIIIAWWKYLRQQKSSQLKVM